MAEYWFEAISWIGLTFCIGAYLIKQMELLRVCSLMGAGLMTIFYGHEQVEQGVIANLIVFAVNLVYLMRDSRHHLKRGKKAKQLA